MTTLFEAILEAIARRAITQLPADHIADTVPTAPRAQTGHTKANGDDGAPPESDSTETTP